MNFKNIKILTKNLNGIIRDMRYCLIENDEVIYNQNGIFRVNCVDCLDRTNIIQTAIAKTIMNIQVGFEL